MAVWLGGRPPAPSATGEALRSGSSPPSAAALRAPLGEVAAPVSFVWDPAPGAASYRFELLDEDGEAVASAVTRATAAPWPADLPQRPGRYYWRVIAELGRGGTVASPLAAFDLVATAPDGL
jgi:hypothetical protein